MTPYLPENQIGVFVVSKDLLKQGVVLGRWFFPQRHPDGNHLEAAIQEFLASMGPVVTAGRKGLIPWVPMESNAVDHGFIRKVSAQAIVEHAKACHRFGLDAVSAYHGAFGVWPTATDIRDRLLEVRQNATVGTRRCPGAALTDGPGGRSRGSRRRQRLSAGASTLPAGDHAFYTDFLGRTWVFDDSVPQSRKRHGTPAEGENG